MKHQRQAIRLKREQEIEDLVTEYKSDGVSERRSAEIANDLFDRFYKVALKIAHKYKNNPISIEDMALAGMKEYKKALGKYDPAHEGQNRLLNYASQRIKFGIVGMIYDHFKISTPWQKHLFSHQAKYRKEAKAKHPDLLDDDLDIVVAKRFFGEMQEKSAISQRGVQSLDDALKCLKDYKARITAGYETNFLVSPDADKSKKDAVSFVDLAADEDAVPVETGIEKKEEALYLRSILRDAFSGLNAREKRVFSARLGVYSEDIGGVETLESLSDELGVSLERVRQIFVRAHEKVQKAIILGAQDMGLTEIAGMNFAGMGVAPANGKKSLFAHSYPQKSRSPAELELV